MISVRKIRDLLLHEPVQPGRPSFVTAASGLVVIDHRFYVSPDDEHHLADFSLTCPLEPGHLLRVLPGDLPVEPKARKKAKPDFESLVRLPDREGELPVLLAVPSGSKPQRRVGVTVTLPARLPTRIRPVDYSPLFLALEREFPKLNLEGAALTSTHLKLFQRGNGKRKINAVIDVALPALLEDLARGQVTPRGVDQIRRYELGDLRGVRLTFTDATSAPDGETLFLAVAEATEDTYEDGPIAGSALGWMDRAGHVIRVEELSPGIKAEGVAVYSPPGAEVQVLLVTDDDDPARPSSLYAAPFRAARGK